MNRISDIDDLVSAMSELDLDECLVCHCSERVSFHFGASSCVACSSFFRRTVSLSIRYLCKADGKCIISQDIRKVCRSCRYEKCVQSGMKRDLVQQRRSDKRIPKYILESRKNNEEPQEYIRDYTTNAVFERNAMNEIEKNRFNNLLDITNDELLQYYTEQLDQTMERRNLAGNEASEFQVSDFFESRSFDRIIAAEICRECPGTDLLDREELQLLFRYCIFVNFLDSAWMTAKKSGNSSSQMMVHTDGKTIDLDGNLENNVLQDFLQKFHNTATRALREVQLTPIEYSVLRAFCIWKLGFCDFTMPLKIVAQEHYYGVTVALSDHYKNDLNRNSIEIATRIADLTLLLTPLFDAFRDVMTTFESLGISTIYND